jgi:AcrR family transcriptional regulator
MEQAAKIALKGDNHMTGNKLDRRVVKTRQIIYDAFFELMKEKPYDKITVQDIIDRANVGRSTFYSHFFTKDELLKSCIESMMEMLNQHLVHAADRDNSNTLIPLVEFFKHIKDNSRLMKSIIRGNNSDLFLGEVQLFLSKKIEAHIGAQLAKGKELIVPMPVFINYISGTLISLTEWWLDNKTPYTPVQMEQYFSDLVTPSIKAIWKDR